MIRPPKPVLLWTITMAVWGCGVRSQTEIPLSSVAKEIEAHGYRAQKRFVNPPTEWEISKFRMRNRVVVVFKAEQPLPNETEKYYCRFSLAEETYDSANDARQRLIQLHDLFPDGPFEDEYTRVLREGFIVDRTLYILQTDAAIFLPEIRRLVNTLHSREPHNEK
jgi:hypothetical protein